MTASGAGSVNETSDFLMAICHWYGSASDTQFLLNPSPDRGAGSWAGGIDPDLEIFLLRTLRQAWHGEVKASVLGIEDGRSCPLRGLYRSSWRPWPARRDPRPG